MISFLVSIKFMDGIRGMVLVDGYHWFQLFFIVFSAEMMISFVASIIFMDGIRGMVGGLLGLVS